MKNKAKPKIFTEFKVEKSGPDRFMAIGYTPDDDEVWCDGAVTKDVNLAKAIRRNMNAAYRQGWKDAKVHLERGWKALEEKHFLGDV